MGWVYILINPSMEGLFKVGKTERTVEERVKELSSGTAVATPYLIAFKKEFTNCTQAEKLTHQYLEELDRRVSKNREFFNGDISDAINFLVKLEINQGNSEEVNGNQNKSKPWEVFFEKGEALEYGLGDEYEDKEEAIEYYRKAFQLGCPYSPLKLAELTFDFEDRSYERLAFYKEGAKRKEDAYMCLHMMKSIYEVNGEYSNAMKAFSKIILHKDCSEIDLICFAVNVVQLAHHDQTFGLFEISKFKSILIERVENLEKFLSKVSFKSLTYKEQVFYGSTISYLGELTNSETLSELGNSIDFKDLLKNPDYEWKCHPFNDLTRIDLMEFF